MRVGGGRRGRKKWSCYKDAREEMRKRRKVLTLCSFECDRSEQLVYSIFTERARTLVSRPGKRKAERRSVDGGEEMEKKT